MLSACKKRDTKVQNREALKILLVVEQLIIVVYVCFCVCVCVFVFVCVWVGVSEYRLLTFSFWLVFECTFRRVHKNIK